jgi:hypothetical protein
VSQHGMFDFLRTQGEAFVNQVSNRLMGDPRFIKALQTALKGKEWLDQAVAQALRTMNVPTRTEFKRALSRIEALEQELAEVRREAAAARRAATARKARARKVAPASATPAGE